MAIGCAESGHLAIGVRLTESATDSALDATHVRDPRRVSKNVNSPRLNIFRASKTGRVPRVAPPIFRFARSRIQELQAGSFSSTRIIRSVTETGKAESASASVRPRSSLLPRLELVNLRQQGGAGVVKHLKISIKTLFAGESSEPLIVRT